MPSGLVTLNYSSIRDFQHLLLLLHPPGERLCDHWVCLSFSLSVCVQDYCTSNQPLSLKLGVMVGPTKWKKWLTFGSDYY